MDNVSPNYTNCLREVLTFYSKETTKIHTYYQDEKLIDLNLDSVVRN